MNFPKISIITVSFNAVNVIEETILSVIGQTYPNIEYIIIDGGSTDGTTDIIKKYADKISYWISEPDKGIYDGMNKGIDKVTGDWVNFMNAGDSFYNKDVVKKIFSQKIDSHIEVIYGDSYTIYSDKEVIEKVRPLDVMIKKLQMPFCHQSVFLKTQNKKNIQFDTSYKIAADYKIFYTLWNKIGKNAFLYIPLPIAIFDAVEGISSQNGMLMIKEYIQIRATKKDIFWWFALIKYIIKYITRYNCIL